MHLNVAPSPPVKPCIRCGSTDRGAHKQCKRCASERQRAREQARSKAKAATPKQTRRQRRHALDAARGPTLTPRSRAVDGCRHVHGKIDIATPAGVRVFENVKVWPQGDALIVLLQRGERIAFGPGMWSAASDVCDACQT